MEEKILQTATEKFLGYGFKSVTMDDIAQELGMSKKTVYTYFSTKQKLVEACTTYLFESIHLGIEKIREEKKNPIVELHEIKTFTMQHLKGEKSSPLYQLQKYYPRIFRNLQEKQFDLVDCCISENIQRGIASGDYREDISVPFVSRMHFAGMQAINEKLLFPGEKYSAEQLRDLFLDYHLRAITTPQGLTTYNELKNQK